MTRSISSRKVALFAVVALVAAALVPAAVLATHGAKPTVAITAPAGGATFTRLDTVAFTGTVHAGTCAATYTLTWELGDGTTSTGSTSASRQYSSLGAKAVNFTAQGGSPSCKDTAKITINIVNVAPTAALADIPEQTAGGLVLLDGSGSSDPDGTLSSFQFVIDSVAQTPQPGATLGHTFTTAGSHTVELSVVDNNGGTSGVSSRTFTVVPAALSSIAVSGPATLVAGATGIYDIAGTDAYGNAVALDATTTSYTTTVAGPAQVSYTEDGVTGTLDITVVPGEAVQLVLDVPTGTEVPAGGSYAYGWSTRDQYGNVVTSGSGLYGAPTTAGPDSICRTEGALAACAPVTVVPAALAGIVVTGPDFPVAGTTVEYTATGEDEYGNDVFVTPFQHSVPTATGPALVCHTQDGFSGCKAIDVQPDLTASVVVSGPDTMVAGVYTEYPWVAYDQYGNVVIDIGIIAVVQTTAGPMDVCAEHQGVAGCKAIVILADDLDRIEITGPTTVVAGSTSTYALAGFDQYDNSVALAQPSLDHTASTSVGADEVSYTELGVTGTLALTVVADQLFTIDVTGPSTMVAGTTATFAATGTDQYGNSVPLSSPTFEFTAPTAVGSANACTTESSVTGCQLVDVVADALATIVISGPDALVAGTTETFGLAGFDQHGNSVPLAQTSLDFLAPTAAGSATVSYEESGVIGEKEVTVLAAALATITVTGPDLLVAGTSGVYSLAGADVYGNPVALLQTSLTYPAGTVAGPATVTHTEGAVTGEKVITVTHAALASIDVSGPASLVAGTTGVYALSGADVYGNAVTLDQASLDFTAPTSVGTANVCYEQDGVEECLTIAVTHDALATIVVTGPGVVAAASTTLFDLAGFDQYGNDVPLGQSTLAFTAPLAVGTATVSYTEGVVTGSKLVQVVAVELTLAIDMGQATYFPTDALLEGIDGSVRVTLPGGASVGGAAVTVAISRMSPLGSLGAVEFSGTTAADGTFAFSVPDNYRLPGAYIVSAIASVGGNQGFGEAPYAVGV